MLLVVQVLKSNSVEESVIAADNDGDVSALSPTKRRSVLPDDSQSEDVCESDVEVPLYRREREQPVERSSSSKSRRSQSLDDVRYDDAGNDSAVAGSNNMCGDDGSVNENGDSNNENVTTGSDEERLGNSNSADDRQEDVRVLDSGAQSIRIIPVVRAESFKEAMRTSQLDMQQPEFSRTISQPPPTTNTAGFSQDSRSSWIMPVFPSLVDDLNELFTSAMARTGSIGSSSGTPRERTRSEASSTSSGGRGIQMRWPSWNSGQMSPLNTPEFHNKRLTRLFDFHPTHLGPISGSSDSLDSSEPADDWTSSEVGFFGKSRLPPGFETGLFDHSFSFRPSLFRMSQSASDPHFSNQLFSSEARSVSGNSSADVRTQSGPRRSQSGSTSRVIPVKVIGSQSVSDDEVAKACSKRATHGSKIADRSNTGNFAEDQLDSAPVSVHKTSSSHSSHSRQPNAHLPAGFLTGFGANISNPNATHHPKVGSRTRTGSGNANVASRSQTDDERKVRVIPIMHEGNPASSQAATRKQGGARGRVIPVMVQSSALSRDSSACNDTNNPTSFQTSKMTPVTVVTSGGSTASNSSTAEAASDSARSDRNFFPLCYDDEEGETVKRILQEMTVKRLPVRDTVRLINMKKSRSMDFDDPKQNAIREESPVSNIRGNFIDSPTVDRLPAGFMVGNSLVANTTSQQIPTASSSVTSDLIRKRLTQFDRGDTNW